MIKAKSPNSRKKYVDDYYHKGMRKLLIKQLTEKGINDQRVLDAIKIVPRHFFLDSTFAEKMYENRALWIEADQTISHPYTVAFQSQLLKVLPGDKILEIGTGSGYQACILAAMGAKVYTIERQEILFEKTSKFLPHIGYRQIRTIFGDGYKGLPRFAPFDKIIVTAGATEIPKDLLHQLAINGRMVIPVGNNQDQRMFVITRVSEKEFESEEHGVFKFVPFLKGTNGLQ